MKRIAICLAAFCMTITSATALAQSGGKPVHLIVAFPAGGPTDFVARVLANELSKEIGQTVIVENKPGANGNIGADYVAKAPPDGSVLFLTTVGAVAISPALYETLPYDPLKDFAPISLVVNNATIFVVKNRPSPNSAIVRKRSRPISSAASRKFIGSEPSGTKNNAITIMSASKSRNGRRPWKRPSIGCGSWKRN